MWVRAVDFSRLTFHRSTLKVLTGEIPFSHISSLSLIPFYKAVVEQGVRPLCQPSSRSNVDLDPLWEIARGCWREDPDDRLTIDSIYNLIPEHARL